MPVRTSHQRPDSDCSAAFAMVEASAVVIPAPRESPATSAPEADASPSPPARRTVIASTQKKKRYASPPPSTPPAISLSRRIQRKADLDRRVLRALRLEPRPQRKAAVAHRSLRRSFLEGVFGRRQELGSSSRNPNQLWPQWALLSTSQTGGRTAASSPSPRSWRWRSSSPSPRSSSASGSCARRSSGLSPPASWPSRSSR